MNLIDLIESRRADLQQIRRDIHTYPELAFEERRTSDLVASRLESWGIDVHRGIAKTGVVGVIRHGSGTRSIGLRADMDALPMQEANQFGHRSQHEGRMHACGHDGHTAMLLGAAQQLASTRNFDGTVYLIFQPAEEGGNAGAREMIRDGLFERFPCDAVFGMHNWPGMPAGHFGLRPGPQMASSSEFRVTVTGKGCHAAMPHNGADPLLAAAQMINALQAIVTRNKNPVDTAVLSVTQVEGGTASNIVPGATWFGGTIRTFTPDVLDLIERRMRTITAGVAAAMECTAEVSVTRTLPSVINTPREAAFAADVLRALVGPQRVDADTQPTMGAEDFAFMLQKKPGCYVFIGNGDGMHRSSGHGLGPCSLHNGSYDFNDDILAIGASFWTRLAEQWLAPA
jgi:hippurate hydrolase